MLAWEDYLPGRILSTYAYTSFNFNFMLLLIRPLALVYSVSMVAHIFWQEVATRIPLSG